MPTNIEWTDETWNPVTGCTKISPGCLNCYAERMAKRLAGRYGYPETDSFQITVHPEKYDQPRHWIKPRRIFVCSMGDLFHEDVSYTTIKHVFDHMLKPWNRQEWHTFIILTKRPRRMKIFIDYFEKFDIPWAKEHIWLGVTVENQAQADKRIHLLLETPASIRFVSVEPMLGPVDLTSVKRNLKSETRIDALNGNWSLSLSKRQDERWFTSTCSVTGETFSPPRLNWVICGGETGPSARHLQTAWVRSLKDQCVKAGVPFFFKKWGNMPLRYVDGDIWEQYPETQASF